MLNQVLNNLAKLQTLDAYWPNELTSQACKQGLNKTTEIVNQCDKDYDFVAKFHNLTSVAKDLGDACYNGAMSLIDRKVTCRRMESVEIFSKKLEERTIKYGTGYGYSGIVCIAIGAGVVGFVVSYLAVKAINSAHKRAQET